MSDDEYDLLRWRLDAAQWGMPTFYFLLAVLFFVAPDSWYPNWLHVNIWIPLALLIFGIAFVIGIRWSKRLEAAILLTVGLMCYVISWIIGYEGVTSHTGLLATPFMMYAGIDMVIDSIVVQRLSRKKGRHRK